VCREDGALARPSAQLVVIAALCAALAGSLAYVGYLLSQPPVVVEHKRLTIVDDAGREVELPVPVERVISLESPVTELIYALGAQDKLVAVDKYSIFPPGVQEEKPVVGSAWSPDMERIVELAPDVVFTWPSEKTLAELEEKGIPTVVFYPHTLDGIKEDILLLGRLLGVPERAREIVAFMDEKLAAITERTADMALENRTRVYIEFYKPGQTIGAGTFTNEFILMAGGVNIAAALPPKFTMVSDEFVVEADPEVIVCVVNPKKPYTTPEEVAARPGWETITAVRESRIYTISYELVNWNPRLVLCVMQLAKWLHPELFADLDLEAEQEELYQSIYGLSAGTAASCQLPSWASWAPGLMAMPAPLAEEEGFI